MKVVFAVLSSLIVASAVCAQTTQYKVVPSSHANLEGNTMSTYPLKYEDVRWQMVIDKAAIAKTQAFLTGMSFRPDGSGSTKIYPSKKLSVTIVLYEVSTTPSTMVKTFKNNIGLSKGKVVFKGTLVLPAAKVGYPLPHPFSVTVPFASLHIFKASGGNLLIDWQETGAYVSNSWNADAVVFNTKTPSGLVNKIWEDKTCTNQRGDQAYLSISTSSNGVLGGSILAKYTMKPSASGTLDLMVLGLGASNHLWGPIKLPLDLAPAGFTSCALAVDLSVLIPALASPVSVSIPSITVFSGVPLYFQGMAVDSKASLLVPTYNAYQVVIQPKVIPVAAAQSVYATKPSTRKGVGFMSPYYYFPILRLEGKLFQ